MMKIMIFMMKLIPVFISRKLPAPMLSKKRVLKGHEHPTIKMNLENLLICSSYCGTCPSNPKVKGEALYCAGGKSEADIIENGCQCVICPLYDKCSSANTAYFCKNGECSPAANDGKTGQTRCDNKDYVNRFLQETENFEEIDKSTSIAISSIVDNNIHEVHINFIGDKIVSTKSNVSLLKASIDAGISHTHVCGGNARCSTCRVVITEGLENCRPRNEKEERLAKIKGFSPEIRLACQTTINDDITARRLVLDDGDISEAINQGRINTGAVGQEIQATILFSDIRSFTSFSENSLPYDVIHILNRYFEKMGDIIDKNGGYIDKYIGDGLMAIFGLDKTNKNSSALLATKSAIEMIEALTEFNEYLKSHFNHQFKIGIGIHTGNVIIGSLGNHLKKEYTAIGDTVNTASRIEALNKRTGTCILISEATYKIVKDRFIFKKKYTTKVKGKDIPVTVYALALNKGEC